MNTAVNNYVSICARSLKFRIASYVYTGSHGAHFQGTLCINYKTSFSASNYKIRSHSKSESSNHYM